MMGRFWRSLKVGRMTEYTSLPVVLVGAMVTGYYEIIEVVENERLSTKEWMELNCREKPKDWRKVSTVDDGRWLAFMQSVSGGSRCPLRGLAQGTRSLLRWKSARRRGACPVINACQGQGCTEIYQGTSTPEVMPISLSISSRPLNGPPFFSILEENHPQGRDVN